MTSALSRRSVLLTPLVAAVSLGLGGAVAWAGQGTGSSAAEIALPDLNGAVVRLSSFRGKVVVIDFFASWCEPCMRELPELEKLHRQLGAAGVVFLGVNLDKERKNAQALVARFGLTFPTLLDPEGRVAESYDPPKMPSTYVVDKAGVVRHINAGFDGAADVARLQKQLTALSR